MYRILRALVSSEGAAYKLLKFAHAADKITARSVIRAIILKSLSYISVESVTVIPEMKFIASFTIVMRRYACDAKLISLQFNFVPTINLNDHIFLA